MQQPKSASVSDPHLIFVTPAFGRAARGGLGVSAERIARHLSTAFPMQVITATADLSPKTYRCRESGGMVVTEVGCSKMDKEFLQFFTDVIEWRSRDVEHPLFLGFYCNDLAYATTLVALRRGLHPVLFARGNDVDLEPFGESAFRIHQALSHASRVFCVSREMEDKIRAFCPGAKVHRVPNGVDHKRFALGSGYRPAAKPVVGMFGEIKLKKGLETLLEALDFRDFDLRIVGHLREEGARLLHGFLTLYPQHREHITHVAYIEDEASLAGQYRSVDIVCLSSTHEGMSNVMLEAMACGKVLVCSAVGGALDVVEDGVNGFLFQPRCAESLREALVRAKHALGTNHAEIGRRARATVLAGFSAKKEARRYLRFFRATLS